MISLLAAIMVLGVSGAGGQDGERGDGRIVKVGVFPVDPIVSVTPGHEPRGFYVDLVKEVARREHWRLVYVPGTWNAGLERLEAGRIDLMTGVARVPARLDRMRFGSQTVLTVWGQVFSRPDNQPHTILDLQGKLVAVAVGDINGINFRENARKFGVFCRFREVPTHEDIFRLIHDGAVDAGVGPNVYGVAHASDFEVVGTAIIFNPLESCFASPRNSDGSLLQTIDEYLARWKGDKNSVYHRSLDNWLGNRGREQAAVPRWIYWTGGAAVLLALIMFLWNRTLNRRIRSRTRELQASEAKQRAIFDQSFQFIGLLDPEGTLLDVNQTALEFIGAPKEEVVGKPFWEAPWWSHSAEAQEELRRGIRVAAAGGVFKSQATHPAADGTLHFVEFSLKGIRDDSGQVRWLVPEGQDVTHYKETREQLARLAQAVEQTADMIIITDTDGAVDYVNTAFTRTTGHNEEDVRGRSLRFLCSPTEDSSLYTRAWFTRLGTASWRGRATTVKHDGTTLEVDVSVSPLMAEQGGVLAYVVVQRDVTQVEELERSLRQAQRLEAVGTLAAGIAHDFNNILAAIFGYTELAQLTLGEDSPAAEYLDEVIIGAERARALVRQILVFGRRTEHEWQLIALGDLVREVLELLRSTLPATITVEDNLEVDGAVMGDSGQIHQVLMNLCTNAFQALEDRGGVLSVSLSRTVISTADDMAGDRLAAGSYMVVEVSDNGPGIDKEMLDKIFEPYFTTKEPGKGTGLGLAVVHGIVQAHHGAVRVESRPGKGSHFRVLLPEFVAPQEKDPQAGDADRRGGDGEHIMFVDDEEVLGRLAVHFFTEQGYRVTAFSDSGEALASFKADPGDWDMVISDQTMPGMTGIDLAAQVLALRPGLPFVLCTGYSTDISQDSAITLGIGRFVQKPIEMEKLGAIVKELLDRRGQEPRT